MSSILRLVGALCIFVGFAFIALGMDVIEILPKDYKTLAHDLYKYRSWLLGGGVLLSMFGGLTAIRSRVRESDQQDEVDTYMRMPINTEAAKHQFLQKQPQALHALAEKLEWTPIAGGGASFKTAILEQVSTSRIEISKSNKSKFLCFIFVGVGLLIALIGGYVVYKEVGFGIPFFLIILFGLMIESIGVVMFIFPYPRIFDSQLGWFWSGSRGLRREQDFNKLKQSMRLSEIAAVQVLGENIEHNASIEDDGTAYTDNDRTFISWEINLVNKDGSRLNVMDHAEKESIDADARKIAGFLNVPVWELPQ